MRRLFGTSLVVALVVGVSSPVQALDDTTKPTVTMTSPSAPFQLDQEVRVAWNGSDVGGSGID